MCNFCDGKIIEIKIPRRTSYAEDNVCEQLSPDESKTCYDCVGCNGCADQNNYFSINYIKDTVGDGNIVDLSYYHKIRNTIIQPISARFEFKYCPFCGKKLTDREIDVNDMKFW